MVALRNLHHNVIKGRSQIIIKCSGPVLQSGPVYQCGLNWVPVPYFYLLVSVLKQTYSM